MYAGPHLRYELQVRSSIWVDSSAIHQDYIKHRTQTAAFRIGYSVFKTKLMGGFNLVPFAGVSATKQQLFVGQIGIDSLQDQLSYSSKKVGTASTAGTTLGLAVEYAPITHSMLDIFKWRVEAGAWHQGYWWKPQGAQYYLQFSLLSTIPLVSKPKIWSTTSDAPNRAMLQL
jgi:hypothetical protein